ncbi:MAG: hypothetical protein HQK77_15815 [Desulfobacterales bacterium]|nr:hypothetical protein [Desulfobacterales bacterium]
MVSRFHIFRQGPMLATLFKTASNKIIQSKKTQAVTIPGDVLKANLPCINPKMVKEYIIHVGGDPAWYKNTIPAHMFHQWGFPILARTIQDTPYDLSKTLNGGVRIDIHHPLVVNEPLYLQAQLIDMDDNGKRVVFKQQLITGTAKNPTCIVCEVTAIVPLKQDHSVKEPKKEKAQIPDNCREIGKWNLYGNLGLDFAFLTGDFNPVHWNKLYARISGFLNCILHGFSTVARSIETLNLSLWSGQVDRLQSFEARLAIPIVVPSQVGVFVDDNGGIFVGSVLGAPANLIGTYTTT